MGNTFKPTSTYSNLTRLELEQLRKADFFAGGRALTVGDSAFGSEGVVGKGNLQAEPFDTGAPVLLDDVYTLTPPPEAGRYIETGVAVGDRSSEIVRWFGPTVIFVRGVGQATAANQLTDPTGNFVFVQPGDLVLVQARETGSSSVNRYAVCTVQSVLGQVLTFSRVVAPNSVPSTNLRSALPTIIRFSVPARYSFLLYRGPVQPGRNRRSLPCVRAQPCIMLWGQRRTRSIRTEFSILSLQLHLVLLTETDRMRFTAHRLQASLVKGLVIESCCIRTMVQEPPTSRSPLRA